MNNPAGGGRQSHGEYIAESVMHESVRIDLAVCSHELDETRQSFIQVIRRVHNTYHGKGVAKPPWWSCTRSTCRLAQQVLPVEDDKGDPKGEEEE